LVLLVFLTQLMVKMERLQVQPSQHQQPYFFLVVLAAAMRQLLQVET
jgi:hypothetical protein